MILANFSYEVLSSAGKRTKGSITGDSREVVMTELKNTGDTIIRCEEAGALDKDINIGFLEKKAKTP